MTIPSPVWYNIKAGLAERSAGGRPSGRSPFFAAQRNAPNEGNKVGANRRASHGRLGKKCRSARLATKPNLLLRSRPSGPRNRFARNKNGLLLRSPEFEIARRRPAGSGGGFAPPPSRPPSPPGRGARRACFQSLRSPLLLCFGAARRQSRYNPLERPYNF